MMGQFIPALLSCPLLLFFLLRISKNTDSITGLLFLQSILTPHGFP